MEQIQNVIPESNIKERRTGYISFYLPSLGGKIALKKNNQGWIISDEGLTFLKLAAKGIGPRKAEELVSKTFFADPIIEQGGELNLPVRNDLRHAVEAMESTILDLTS